MISPKVRMTDLDDGFARLCGLVARRDQRVASVLTVLHDAGDVINVVHSGRGAVPEFREPITDPLRDAVAMRTATSVDRVVLIDRRGLDALSADVVALARSTPVQSELLIAAQERFWSHPSVVTVPEPPRSPWPAVQRALAAMADDWLLLVVWDGDAVCSSVLTHVVDGLIVDVSSLPGPFPRKEEAVRLVDVVAVPLTAVLAVDLGDLEHLVRAERPLDALRALLDGGGTLHSSGIEAALWPEGVVT